MSNVWYEGVALLMKQIEGTGEWPKEVVEAYVAMIPKAAGSSRPQDCRPITVLDVLYRIWAKGTVLTWSPVVQREYLGKSAMGFRTGSGTIPLAQMLSDLIHLQQQRSEELWLVSFDVEKCFPSLPWWGIFGVMHLAGMSSVTIKCFSSFYKALVQRFRFGQLDGEPWHMLNGVAQGCPASPDLMNLLFEAFHRWASSLGYGVQVVHDWVASVSFADDIALVGVSLVQITALVQGYVEWCGLLWIKIHVEKTQVWSNQKALLKVTLAGVQLDVKSSFKMVGVELGLNEKLCSQLQFTGRFIKARQTAERLRSLKVPASIAAQMWHMTVLPQALYGCEIRIVPAVSLDSLAKVGKAVVGTKEPLLLCQYRASEIVSGMPLGQSAMCEPWLEMQKLRLGWPSPLGIHLHLRARCIVSWGRLAASQPIGWNHPRFCERQCLAWVGH
jgi:hypothetical protein